MLRNLSLVFIVATVLWSADGLALSLGDIATKSALDQPFKADVDLYANPAEIDGLRIAIGSSFDFARAGLERSLFLTKLKFKVIQIGERLVVRITSNMPVREPFLSFLLDVNWPNGHILKKFTTLLDPKPQTTPRVTNSSRTEQPQKNSAISPTVVDLPLPLSTVTSTTDANESITPVNTTKQRRRRPRTVTTGEAPTLSSVATSGDTNSSIAPLIAQLHTDLATAKEIIQTNRNETNDLRSKVQNLEQQLNDVRHLVDKFQSEQSINTLSVPPPSPQVMEIPVVPTVQPPEVSVPVEPVVVQPPPPSIAEPPVTEPQIEAPVNTQPISAPNPLVNTEIPIPPPESPPFDIWLWLPFKFNDISLDQILNDQFYQSIAGGLVLLTLVTALGIWLYPRKSPVEPEYRSDVDLNIDSGMHHSGTVMDESSTLSTLTKKPEVSSETSMFSDFSQSDMDELQKETGEVDPGAEADVYIAYGRYQQAEILIKQTLDQSPERTDLKLKLLEIFYTTRNVSDFIGLAESLNANGFSKSDAQAWERVCSMGRELLPSHSLFGMYDRQTEPRGRSERSTANQVHESMDDLSDINLETMLSQIPEANDFGRFQPNTPQTATTAPRPIERSDSQPSTKPSKIIPYPPPQPPSIAAMPSVAAESDPGFNIDLSSIGSFDIGDLDFGSAASIKTQQEQTLPISEFDSSVSQISNDEQFLQAGNFSLDDLDMGSDINLSMLGNIDEDESFLSSQVSDSTEGIETKLDLAEAYMGVDNDMARDILGEIVDNGNPAQQAKARSMLDKIKLDG